MTSCLLNILPACLLPHQDWALLDLTCLAEEAPSSKRRAALFSDETGLAGWVPLVSYCMQEVNDLVAVLSAALATLKGTWVGGWVGG